jgi:hypothetical protein
MNGRFSVATLCLVMGLCYLTACSKTLAPPMTPASRSVQELRAGYAALQQFSQDLGARPVKNDFQKFASSPDNYYVSVQENEGSFVYTFTIKSYQNRPVLDGVLAHEVNKSDLKVARTSDR